MGWFSNEIWKDVIGYKGLYQISSYGRVNASGELVIFGPLPVGQRHE